MKRYKLIGTQSNWPSFTPGKIYDADYISDDKFLKCTVQRHAELTPSNWELIEEFTLPENWCIKSTPETFDVIKKWLIETDPDKNEWRFYSKGDTRYITYRYTDCKYIPERCTDITFDQFEKYVLMKDKEIIGYKLKEDCKQYNIAAAKIEGYTQCGVANVSTKVFYINENRSAINAWNNANVLDLWFEPVYKETKTLPEINGYKGEITQISGIVKYGCAQLSSKGIESFLKNRDIGVNREINSITLDSGVEITIEQLQQIADYFKD